MSKILLVGYGASETAKSLKPLEADGLFVTASENGASLGEVGEDDAPDLLLLDTTSMTLGQQRAHVQECHRLEIPVVGLLPKESLPRLDVSLGLDDFVLLPLNPAELKARIKQILWRSKGEGAGNVIRAGDLVIDLDRYEVSVSGRKVLLTFKEYELLRLLASNPGVVYSREALLSKVWGYDYFGGTRTVDVHVRRLRSKIEDTEHSFVETVWNVGYRFKEDRRSPAG